MTECVQYFLGDAKSGKVMATVAGMSIISSVRVGLPRVLLPDSCAYGLSAL